MDEGGSERIGLEEELTTEELAAIGWPWEKQRLIRDWRQSYLRGGEEKREQILSEADGNQKLMILGGEEVFSDLSCEEKKRVLNTSFGLENFFPCRLWDGKTAVVLPESINPVSWVVTEHVFDRLKKTEGEVIALCVDEFRQAVVIGGLVYGKFDEETEEGRTNREIISPYITEDDPEFMQRMKVEGVEIAPKTDSARLEQLKKLEITAFKTAIKILQNKREVEIEVGMERRASGGIVSETTKTRQARVIPDENREFKAIKTEILKVVEQYSSNPMFAGVREFVHHNGDELGRELAGKFFKLCLQEINRVRKVVDEKGLAEMAENIIGSSQEGAYKGFSWILGQSFIHRVAPVEQMILLFYFGFAFSNGFQVREKSFEQVNEFFMRQVFPKLREHHDLIEKDYYERWFGDITLEELDWEKYKEAAVRAENTLDNLSSEAIGVVSLDNREFVEEMKSRLEDALELKKIAERLDLGFNLFTRRLKAYVFNDTDLKYIMGVAGGAVGFGAALLLVEQVVFPDLVLIGGSQFWKTYNGLVTIFGLSGMLMSYESVVKALRREVVRGTMGRKLGQVGETDFIDGLRQDLEKIQERSNQENVSTKRREILKVAGLWIMLVGLGVGGLLGAGITLGREAERQLEKRTGLSFDSYSIPDNYEIVPELGKAKFYVWGLDETVFWVRHGAWGWNGQPGVFDLEKEDEFESWKQSNQIFGPVEVNEWDLEKHIQEYVDRGYVVRMNIDRQDNFFEIPVGYEPVQILTVGGEDVSGQWHPLTGLTVNGNWDKVLVVYGRVGEKDEIALGSQRQMVSDSMEDAWFVSNDLIYDGEYQTGSLLEELREPVVQARADVALVQTDLRKGAVPRMTYGQIMEQLKAFIDERGIDYGFADYTSTATRQAEQVRELLDQEELICNQFSHLVYVMAQEAGINVYVINGYQYNPMTGYGGYNSQRHQIVMYQEYDGSWHAFESTLPDTDGNLLYPQPRPGRLSPLEKEMRGERAKEMLPVVGLAVPAVAGLVGLGLVLSKLGKKKEEKRRREEEITDENRINWLRWLAENEDQAARSVFLAVCHAVEHYGILPHPDTLYGQTEAEYARRLAGDLASWVTMQEGMGQNEVNWWLRTLGEMERLGEIELGDETVSAKTLTQAKWFDENFWEKHWEEKLMEKRGANWGERRGPLKECLRIMIDELEEIERRKGNKQIEQARVFVQGFADLLG